MTAFVDRLHDGRDWLKGRSECDSCKKTLGAADLVPVFSWLLNRGRCRQCHKKISIRYPLTEILTALAFWGSYLLWPESLAGFEVFKFIVWLGLVVAMVALVVFDIRWYLIPDRIMYPMILVAAVLVGIESIWFGGGTNLVRESVLGLATIGGLFYGLFVVSSGRWIGGGDVKLAFFFGILVGGPMKALLIVMLSSVAGTLLVLPLLGFKRVAMKTQIPFGPLLIAAGYFVFLVGNQIYDWYFVDLLGANL